MKIVQYEATGAVPVEMAGADGVSVRIPIGEADGAPTFTMRVFTLRPGGNTPFHRHDYEHEIIVLKGRGEALGTGEPVPVAPGTVLFVPPDEWHGFRADSREGMEMICLVPNRAYHPGVRVEPGTAPERGTSGK